LSEKKSFFYCIKFKLFLYLYHIINKNKNKMQTKFFKSYKDANNFIARNINKYSCKLTKLHNRDIYINNIDNYKVEFKTINK